MSSRIVTYSPAYTLVPTYECFNRCTYCNFRANPGESPWLSLAQAEEVLMQLQDTPVCEILVLSGEVHPLSPQRKAWLQRIYDICELALSLGFLPHTNVGPLSYAEMTQLKQVNVSMGLMIEQITPELLKNVHRHAPSKVPKVRLQQLEWAGELNIPFTTGLLLGIGETSRDWWESLEAIATIQQRWGHLQEVILQPHSPGEQQSFSASAFNPLQLPEVIAKARDILPDSITIQIPPNLIPDSAFLLACLEAGARDLGGIGIRDEVNPTYSHQEIQTLAEVLDSAGWQLQSRLPVYPSYYSWLNPALQSAITAYASKRSILTVGDNCG